MLRLAQAFRCITRERRMKTLNSNSNKTAPKRNKKKRHEKKEERKKETIKRKECKEEKMEKSYKT
jgi:hypothetical protein